MPLRIDACVAQHRGDRREQQDRAGLFEHAKIRGVVLAALADGMGGHTGGALAAEQVLHTARTSLDMFSPTESAGDLLAASMREAHMLIRSGRFLNEQDPHSTAAMLLLYPRDDRWVASWAHCGDSRVYHFRRGQTLARTSDHSYVEQLVAAGKLTPAEADHHAERNVLVTSLGGVDEPHVDQGGSEDIRGGDAFLLCSDGLWAYVPDSELGHVATGYTARDGARMLIERARARAEGKGDNCSLVIVRLVEVADKPVTLPPKPRPR